MERPEPAPVSPGPNATAKAGRPNRSLSRAATSPTTPGCQRGDAVTTTAPRSSRPSAAIASASASATAASSMVWRSRLRRSSSAASAGGFGGVLAQQQPGAEIGAADPPARIDARPQHEAEMPRLRRPGEPRRVDERGEPDALAPPHRDQPLGDEGAVEALERHHVGDGAERDEIDEIEKVGLRAAPHSRSRAGAARG